MAAFVIPKLVGWGILSKAVGGAILNSSLLNFAGSVLLSAAAAALNRPKGSDLSRELSAPNSLPPYRHAYGRGVRIQGSGAPFWVVKTSGATNVLYGCLILNSRPSDGSNFAMFLDSRPVGLSGDLRDFGTVTDGDATVAEGDTFVTVTHGLGGTPVAAGVTAWNDDGVLTVSNITSTTFRINLTSAAPSGGTPVEWRAVLATDGGIALNSPFAGYVNVWLGTGDQQHPPALVLQEMGDLRGLNTQKFWHTDRWTGRTVLWVRFDKGPTSTTRWPSSPPMVEVQADWSRVWDPRDEAQDPDDPDTWTVSDNQALCLLDALRQNPLARYPDAQIRLGDFIDAANIADQFVRLKSGGSERRYRVGGMIAYTPGAELADVIAPLERAGAGTLFRAGGLIGYAPGAWAAPEITLSHWLRDAPMTCRHTRPSRDVPGALKAVHPDPAAGWEMAETPARAVANDWTGGDDRIKALDLGLVFSATQAQRVLKIEVERLKLPRQIGATFPPEAIEAMAGARVTLDLPREGDTRSGIYRVTRAHPAQWLESDDGVALALPLDLDQDAEAVYAWDHTTDEAVIIDQSTVPPDPTVPLPVWVSAALDGADLDYSAAVPSSYVTDPNIVVTASVDAVEVRYRRNQEPFWLTGSNLTFSSPIPDEIEITGTGSIVAALTGSSYDIALRSVIDERVSAWVTLYAVPVGITLAAPSGVSATAGVGEIEIDATAPADTDCHAVQIWVGTTSDPEGAWLVDEVACDPSDPVTATATGLPAVVHSIFVRAVTSAGAVGPWAATVTATPT